MGILQNIDIHQLQSSGGGFNFSPSLSDELQASIEKVGVVVRPGIYFDSNGPVVLYGHNRISALASLGMASIEVEVFEPDNIFKAIGCEFERKKMEGSLAPVSLLMLVRSIKFSGLPGGDEVLKNFPVPAFFRDSHALSTVLDDMDFCSYALEKKTGMKIIRSFAMLSADGRGLVSEIIRRTAPRINILKEIISLVDECLRTGRTIELNDDVLKNENRVLDHIKKIRYPMYHSLFEEAEKIRKEYLNPGITMSFPSYFEGGFADIHCRIYAEETSEGIREKIGKISDFDFERLLAFLNKGGE